MRTVFLGVAVGALCAGQALAVEAHRVKYPTVGCFDRGGAVTRIEAVIAATQKPPTVIFRRDLTRLGPGYRIDQLVPAGNE